MKQMQKKRKENDPIWARILLAFLMLATACMHIALSIHKRKNILIAVKEKSEGLRVYQIEEKTTKLKP